MQPYELKALLYERGYVYASQPVGAMRDGEVRIYTGAELASLETQPLRWWVWQLEDDQLIAWGTDIDEAAMIAHLVQLPQLHPELPFGERMRAFGIELGEFDPDISPAIL